MDTHATKLRPTADDKLCTEAIAWTVKGGVQWPKRQEDVEFERAYVESREAVSDLLEEILIEKAREGDLGAVIFALKIRGRGPQRQRSEEEIRGYDFPFSDLAEEAERVNSGFAASEINT